MKLLKFFIFASLAFCADLTYAGITSVSPGGTVIGVPCGGSTAPPSAITSQPCSSVTTISSTGGSLTLSQSQYKNLIIEVTGTLTSNLLVTFPTIAGQWSVINGTTGSYTVTAGVSGQATPVSIPVSKQTELVSDGTNLYIGSTVSSLALSSTDSCITIAGSPVTTSGSISLALSPLPVTCGGNGLVTATLGDLRYGSGTNTLTALPGNITTTTEFLCQTGSGTVSAAPAWCTIATSNLPSLSSGYTGVLPLANGGTNSTNGSISASNTSGYTFSNSSGNITSGTTGFGDNFVGTVNDSSAVDGIISFANITCTLCTATSYLADWQVGGSSKFKVNTGGGITASTITATNGQLNLSPGNSTCATGAGLAASAGSSLILCAGTNIAGATLNTAGQLSANYNFQVIGHVLIGGTVLTSAALSSCGTTPAINSTANDFKGTITEGTTATGCTLTFLTAYTTAPDCVISSPTGTTPTSYTTSTTALTIVNASASGNKFTYHCIQ